MVKRLEQIVGGRALRLETGRLAKQAAGSAIVQYGETMILAAVTVADQPTPLPFFPLTVEYREKSYAAGKIPGGFIKREGRPSDDEILAARLTDRSLRPLFPDGDVLGITGASLALGLSRVPWNGPIAGVRVGRVEGQWVLNPTFQQLEFSDADIVVAGSRDSLVMVEGSALELPEGEIADALAFAQRGISDIVAWQEEIIRDLGVSKMPWTRAQPPAELGGLVRELAGARVREALNLPEKSERAQALAALRATLTEQLAAEFPENAKDTGSVLDEIEYETMRQQ
ncbi:MAG: polyribonucleotide nucleotidyltransferase, partial [Gemmatimonadetes bacterium]|nr:polyribonucleotide nucleotidyltransferase [Gemmatimonadota bacterium]